MKTQLTATLPGIGVDASQVQQMIDSKGYFGKPGNSWSSAFDYSMDNSLVLCALGCIISHLSRFMVCLNSQYLCFLTYLSRNSDETMDEYLMPMPCTSMLL